MMNRIIFIALVVVVFSMGGAGLDASVQAQGQILEGFEADPGQPIPPCPEGSITTLEGCALPDAV